MPTKYVGSRIYNYDFSLGTTGTGGKSFYVPVDFALGSGGSLYVLSRGKEGFPLQGITKCTLDHEFVWEDRAKKFLDMQAPMPNSIAVDSQENVYVSEEQTNHIYIFDRDGNRLGNWGSGSKGITLSAPSFFGQNEVALESLPSWNSENLGERLMPISNNYSIPFQMYLKKVGAIDTSGDGDLNGPSGLTFDHDDNLFISDSYNHRVQKFTKDGAFLAKFGRYGNEEGELNLPWGLAIDKDGNVYVADWGNSRVQKFSSEGQHLVTFGAPGSGEGELHRPSGVAVDEEGDVYVTDWDVHRLVIYDADGKYLTSFEGDEVEPSPWRQERIEEELDVRNARKRAEDLSIEKKFRWPVAVNVDDEGRIMVLESQAARIQVYVKEKHWVEPPYNI